jgi:molecular chaperone GrpE
MADKKSKRETELEQHLGELTSDLQRVQADFINYRTRMEEDKKRLITGAKAATIMKLLPVIDNIERATLYMPAELEDNQWAKGVSSLGKNLEKSLAELGLERIAAKDQPFDPNLHEAISAEGEGDHEVVSDELRTGYLLDGQVVRHSLVKVVRQDLPQESTENVQQVIDDTKTVDTADEVKGED